MRKSFVVALLLLCNASIAINDRSDDFDAATLFGVVFCNIAGAYAGAYMGCIPENAVPVGVASFVMALLFGRAIDVADGNGAHNALKSSLVGMDAGMFPMHSAVCLWLKNRRTDQSRSQEAAKELAEKRNAVA